MHACACVDVVAGVPLLEDVDPCVCVFVKESMCDLNFDLHFSRFTFL